MGETTHNPGASPISRARQDNFDGDPRVPHDFLLHPAKITKQIVEWKKTDLPENDGLYATVLEDCFTAAECKALVSMAEAQTNGVWEQAMINVGGGRQEFNSYARDCGRIILDDRDIVERIWNRVKDEVPEIEYLINMPRVTGNGPAKRKETWRLSRLNERMRFLKYGEGQYFKPHMDGCYVTPDNSEYTFYTLHLYLNDSTQGKIGGGATTFRTFLSLTFLPSGVARHVQEPYLAISQSMPSSIILRGKADSVLICVDSMNMLRQFDVEPKIGRVLIFQHRDLLHSGADVTSGIKLTLRTDLMYKKVVVEE